MGKDKIVKKVFSQILEIYPFLNLTEQQKYVERVQKLLEINLESVTPVELLQQILTELHNGHADIKKMKTNRKHKPSRENFSYKLKNEILYIKIPHWVSDKSFAENLIKICQEQEGDYFGIIIDVRGNEGGNSIVAHQFAQIFFKEDIEFGTIYRKTASGDLEKLPNILLADKDIYIDAPIVILVDNLCYSSNELFLAPFKASKRATLIGMRTKGGSANPETFMEEIKSEQYRIRIPRWRFFLSGESRPIEETGITPDIEYKNKDIVRFAEEVFGGLR